MKKTDDIDLYIRSQINLVKKMDSMEKALNYYASRFDKLEAAILNKPDDLTVGDVALAEENPKKQFFVILKTATLKLRNLLGVSHIRYHARTSIIIS
jgi:hypothetical protein